jgi:hypothetical protein
VVVALVTASFRTASFSSSSCLEMPAMASANILVAGCFEPLEPGPNGMLLLG